MDRRLEIVSIQSHVAYGHVGNSAAVFPMQRLGCEVWPIHTVQFSNHPGYSSFRGEILPARLVDDCVTGLAERSALERCDAVLSGYAGTREIALATMRAVALVRQANPWAIYCCDPVIGDSNSGIYVHPELAAFLRDDVIRVADILTPNQFELGYLAGADASGSLSVHRALAVLHARGPRIIVVTSAALDDTPADAIDILVSTTRRAWRVRTPRLAIAPNGAGDALAALFLVHWLRTKAPDRALARAVSSLFGVLAHTADTNQREIALIAAQEELVVPTRSFQADLLPSPEVAPT